MRYTLLLFLPYLLFSCKGSTPNYDEVAGLQPTSIPIWQIPQIEQGKALLVFAHADDEIACAGLVSSLIANNYTVHLLTLTMEEMPGAETRIQENQCAAEVLGIGQVDLAGLYNNPWPRILSDSLLFWKDETDSIRTIIENKINTFQPDILITFDSEIGGYGHSEHRISASLTQDIFMERKGKKGFAPQFLLQSTLPQSLEDFILKGAESYNIALKLTGSQGLPQPDVAIDLQNYWPTKNLAAQCYKSQIKILRKFYLTYDEENENKHKKAFSHEYYRLLKN